MDRRAFLLAGACLGAGLLGATPAGAAAIGPEPPAPHLPELDPAVVAGLARGGATQLLVVQAARTTGLLTAWRDSEAGWQRELGPWPAWLGVKGVAAPGAKREGDGRTPSGVFALPFAFGTVDLRGRTGLPTRRISGPWDCWVDDPRSPVYDRWVDRRRVPASWTRSSESLPRYERAVAVNANPHHTPGRGSAILVHVSRGRPSVGCVSLDTHKLDRLLRWLDGAARPHLAVGTPATLTRASGAPLA